MPKYSSGRSPRTRAEGPAPGGRRSEGANPFLADRRNAPLLVAPLPPSRSRSSSRMEWRGPLWRFVTLPPPEKPSSDHCVMMQIVPLLRGKPRRVHHNGRRSDRMAEGGGLLVIQQNGRFCRRLLWSGAESAVKETRSYRCAKRRPLFLWSCLPVCGCWLLVVSAPRRGGLNAVLRVSVATTLCLFFLKRQPFDPPSLPPDPPLFV